jgi:hypothetical protein
MVRSGLYVLGNRTNIKNKKGDTKQTTTKHKHNNTTYKNNKVGVFDKHSTYHHFISSHDHTGKFMKITRKMIDPITFAENYEVTSHLEDTSIDQTYYQGMELQESQKVRKVKVSKERRFSDKVEIFIIPDLDENSIEELFYTEDQVADMRHEAFLESCGLSPADFDCEIDSD